MLANFYIKKDICIIREEKFIIVNKLNKLLMYKYDIYGN